MLKKGVEKKIYYHDTDAGGVVYYGNYLKYLEEARTEFLEQKGLSVYKLQQQGFLYAVRKCTILYKSPVRYGDFITVDARLTALTAAQLIFAQQIMEAQSQRLVVEAEVILVSLDKNFKPAVIPPKIRDALLNDKGKSVY